MQALPSHAQIPRNAQEVKERVAYSQDLQKRAYELVASGAKQEKIDKAFQKLTETQKGLCFHNNKKALEDAVSLVKYGFNTPWEFFRKKIAFFDRVTSTLTISEKEAKKNRYVKGQELPVKIGNKAQMGFYYWDKKFKTPKQIFVSIAFHDSEYVNETGAKGLTIPCGFYDFKQVEPQKINEIKILTKEGMNQLINTIPVHVPLFDISDEKAQAQMQERTIRPLMEIDEKSGANLLTKWMQKPLDPTAEEIGYLDPANSQGNIYSIEKDHFLSNDYLNDLVIPGDNRSPYKSVTHYLIYKKIDQCSLMGMNVKGLVNEIERCKTAHDAKYFYKAQTARLPNFSHEVNMFQGLDNELKKALFYKFVGTDGKPNKEGKKLLDTGEGKIFAGHETVTAMVNIPLYGESLYHMLDDPSYFVDQNLQGANKLGKCLMELRKMLRKQEQKNGNLNMFYTPQNSSSKPLPQPKPKLQGNNVNSSNQVCNAYNSITNL